MKAGTALIVVFGLSSPAWAYVYSTQYEMINDPSVAAGVIDADNSDYNNNGILNVGANGSGATFAGGIMEYIDNTTSGSFGYYFAGNNTVTSYTIDMRVKVLSGVEPSGGSRSMGFSGGPDLRDRALRLNTGSVQFANGASVLGSPGTIDFTSDFVDLRLTYNWVTNVYSVFHFDTDGPLTTTSGGGSGPADPIHEHGGWHIGSLAGGGTTDTHFYLDYFRILIGTAIEDPTTEIAQIPEPATMGLLAIGSLFLRPRRGQRANISTNLEEEREALQ